MKSDPINASPPVTQDLLDISNSGRWGIVWLLFAASLINYFDRATISVALPLLSADLHLGPSAKGVLLSAFFWSYALMQIPIGWCADRYNLRWLYAGTFALWSLAQGLTGFAGSLAVLIFFRVLLGIGESIFLPGGSKLVSILFKHEERGLPSGLFDFGSRIGMVLGGLLIPTLLLKLSWRMTFALAGFVCLLWLAPWLLVTPARLASPRTNQNKEARKLDVRALFGMLKNRNLLGICFGFFCFDYYWYLLVTWLLDYLVNVRHLTILTAGAYTALPFLVFGICQPLGGWIADWLVRKGFDETRTRKGIVGFSFATGLLIIPAARAETAPVALLLIMGGSLVGLAAANMLVILQGCAPVEDVATWTGYENFFGNLAGVLAPLVTGLLISATGSYFPGFAIAGLVLILGAGSYLFIVGELRPPAKAISK